MTSYSEKDLRKIARDAVKHAECYTCGRWIGRVSGNKYQGWRVAVDNQNTHLRADYICKDGHTAFTTIAI
jgi:hypothetical protein